MLALSSGLLRTGLALKLNQIKRATSSYLRDRTNQATGTATSYAVAAGLFAAAGIFLIAALLVGATALFRWIEIKYGLFQAFGAVGGLLVVIAAICAGVASSRLKRPAPQFPSLAQPPARRHQRQSDQAGPGRGRHAIRGNGSSERARHARDRCQPRAAEPHAPVRAGQPKRAGRPDRGGDAAGLGGRAPAAGATNGKSDVRPAHPTLPTICS